MICAFVGFVLLMTIATAVGLGLAGMTAGLLSGGSPARMIEIFGMIRSYLARKR